MAHSAGPGGLEIRGLVAGYGSTMVLRDIQLVAPPGEVVALLGPNGAGKTTVLRSVFGMTTVRSGSIRYRGEDITERTPHDVARRGLCYVTDGRAIFRTLTVEENLDMFAGGRAPAAETERVFGLFPVLGERRRHVAGTLSGGQQQMLAMARAILPGDHMLLVDELSMGLAPLVVDELFEVLATLKADGRGILLVEQYAQRALALADEVYVLNRGELVFCGEPHELLGSPELIDLYVGGGGQDTMRRAG